MALKSNFTIVIFYYCLTMETFWLSDDKIECQRQMSQSSMSRYSSKEFKEA